MKNSERKKEKLIRQTGKDLLALISHYDNGFRGAILAESIVAYLKETPKEKRRPLLVDIMQHIILCCKIKPTAKTAHQQDTIQ